MALPFLPQVFIHTQVAVINATAVDDSEKTEYLWVQVLQHWDKYQQYKGKFLAAQEGIDGKD